MVDEEAEYAYNNIKTKYICPFTFAHLIFIFFEGKNTKNFSRQAIIPKKLYGKVSFEKN
jgi:hypothetical protein